MNKYYVYIMADKKNGTIYMGVTGNLIKRVYEHKNDLADGFTKKHKTHNLVCFDEFGDIDLAIQR